MPVEFFGLRNDPFYPKPPQAGKKSDPHHIQSGKIYRGAPHPAAGDFKTMKFTARSMVKTGMVFKSYNKNKISDLTAEKLSGFGVLPYKDTTSALPEAAGLGLCFYVKKN